MTNNAKGGSEEKLHTPVFRVAWPHMFTAKSSFAGQEAKYSLSMLFPKVITDPNEKMLMEKLKAAVTAAAVGKWGPDKNAWPTQKIQDGKGGILTIPAIASPWHDGSEKDYDGYGKDVVYASASSKFKPGLVSTDVIDTPEGQKLRPITDPSEFYGGCYARATLTVFAYANKKMGVSFGLRSVQKLRDGVVLRTGSSPDDDFDAIPAPGGIPAGVGAGAGVAAATNPADPFGM